MTPPVVLATVVDLSRPPELVLEFVFAGSLLRARSFQLPPTDDQEEARKNPSSLIVEDLGLVKVDPAMTAYERHILDCTAAAERWERAAEKARLAGRFELARLCTERSARLRYLAEDDPDVADLFNATGRWA